MNKKLVVLSLLLSLTAVSHAQVQAQPKYSDWAPIVHLPAPINSEFDDHAAIPAKGQKRCTSRRTVLVPSAGSGEHLGLHSQDPEFAVAEAV